MTLTKRQREEGEKYARYRLEPGFKEMQHIDDYPGIYIGNKDSLLNMNAIREHDITHILSMNGQLPMWLTSYNVKVVTIDDEEYENIAQHFGEIYSFIDDCLTSGGRVLVYCTGGVSRSATAVLCYLVVKHNVDVHEGIRLLKSYRKWVDPNAGFVRQLEAFREEHLCKTGVGRSCELCDLKKTTEWFQEDPRFVVIECDQCEAPMAVWRTHTMDISPEDARDMEAALRRWADTLLGPDKYIIDKKQRTIYDHLHWHARPKPFWMKYKERMNKSKL